MKKNMLKLISLLVGLSIVLAACGNNSQPSEDVDNSSPLDKGSVVIDGEYDLSNVEPMELIISSALSVNHGCWEGFYVPWMAAVENKSDGLISFQVYTGGELVDYGNELDSLRDGLIDIAAPLTPVYDTSRFPTSDVGMLPIGESTSVVGTKAYDIMLESDEVIEDGKTYYEMEFGDSGLFYIGHNVPPGSAINTTGKEINTIDDFNGLRIRTGSRTTQIYAETVGLTPISMPAYELFDAMSRGSVDGSFIHVADWTAYGFQDLFEYSLTGINFGHFTAGLAMDQERFNSLPEPVQQIFIESAKEVKIPGAEVWDHRTNEIMESTSAKGTKFVDFNSLPSDVQSHMEDAIVETWIQYIDMQENNGVPGKKIAKLWHDSIVEAGGTIPSGVTDLFK